MHVLRAAAAVAFGVGLSVSLGACASSSAGSSPSGAPAAVASPTASLAAATASIAATASGDLAADVDVGGRLIHVSCRGAGPPGTPTVLLEQGLDGSTGNWSSVLPSLGALTRVCAYDRAGLGRSDPAPDATRTLDDAADDLEATLAGAGIQGPFVIVAHSLGPWISTVYLDRHPEDVVGAVFVDPRGPGVSARHLAALGDALPGEAATLTEVRAFMTDGGFDDNLEHLRFAPSEAQVGELLERPGPFFGDRPVMVLRADRTIDAFPDLPSEVRAAWWDIWREEQERYADESSAGEVIDVPNSTHMVMDDRPRAVIDAVARLLETVREP